ncbi:MAG TPA: hypothetical protein VGQ12_18035 [Candidatus Angelobacter sp.]|jgi:hypothetical protein|nr:hypothetical protein [Candidatus Angelobacter sp.]
MYRKPVTLKRRAVYSFGLGCGIFLLGVALRALLDNLGVSGVTAAVDDLLIGVLAGVLVFAYERHQHKLILEKMLVISEMNHHVRNALQPIMYSPYLKEQAEQIRIIQEGTRRIEWALREVLPGEDAIPPTSKSRSVA